ncbi:hypothetical protein IWX48DRAFT_401867 [Phyllosticta citricarpa]
MHSDIPIWFALGFLWASKSTPLRQLPMNTLPPSLLYRIWSIASISTPFETSFTINLVQQVAPRAGYLDNGCKDKRDRLNISTCISRLSLNQSSLTFDDCITCQIRPNKTRRAASTAAGEHSARLELTLVRIPRDAPSTRSFASDCFHPSRPSQSRQIRAKVQLLIVREVVASQVGDEKSKARE